MQLACTARQELASTSGSACLRRLATGRHCRPSLGAAKFFCPSDPAASAGIARRIPRTRILHEIAAVVDEAHRHNVKVTIHSRGSTSTRAAAKAGVDLIYHADLTTSRAQWLDHLIVRPAGHCADLFV